MARARSGVVGGFPEVWLDAEGEIGTRAGGNRGSSSLARQESRCLSRRPIGGTGRRMSNTGDPPRNLGRPNPAVSGLLIRGCVMKITGGQVSLVPAKRFVKSCLRGGEKNKMRPVSLCCLPGQPRFLF